ncbi:MAG: polyhydroxyalkanoate synthesis repressor PhaR [Alphaproteobacteria bacterium]|nr:polyhydroxyalkanoate synthesis repressor PhaR [Alphaproteobacteria bacterium]MCB9930539.1 polyhydroxyalkanoate synthesis repressor PhaR [Alphaproteobacteria bacterium]
MPQKRPKSDSASDDVIIKKYANRRLYNTSTSSYVTLEDLRKMVQEDINFRVIDAKTHEDLTRSVLTQIIVEEESRGQNLLPISFLRQIIAMYEDNMRWTLPQYLETAMGWYARHQQEVQRQVSSSFGGMMPPALEEMQRQQLALFDQAVRMFSPGAGAGGNATKPPEPPPAPKAEGGEEIADLRERIAALQHAVETLAKKGEG